MEKTYKRVPFDIELARKIQAGEIEGKIKYSENDGYAYDADIIKFDLIADKSRAKPNSTLFRTIAAIIEFDNYQGIRTFNIDGYGYNINGDDTKLFIEVPDNEPQFKPFDKVLVRHYDVSLWQPAFFWKFFDELSKTPYYTIDGNKWEQCILYEGNEHLVGTTDNF